MKTFILFWFLRHSFFAKGWNSLPQGRVVKKILICQANYRQRKWEREREREREREKEREWEKIDGQSSRTEVEGERKKELGKKGRQMRSTNANGCQNEERQTETERQTDAKR